MRRHMTYVDHRPSLPVVPCDECYSVESYSRRIPYEPDSRTENVTYPKSDAIDYCDGSHTCPAERHIFGCFRSTLADDTEGHPNWVGPYPQVQDGQ